MMGVGVAVGLLTTDRRSIFASSKPAQPGRVLRARSTPLLMINMWSGTRGPDYIILLFSGRYSRLVRVGLDWVARLQSRTFCG